MYAIRNTAYANPLETLELADIDEPENPEAGEVLIQMAFAPINGNDLNVIAGHFPFHPPLPSLTGNEGVGRVVAVGDKVAHVKVGDLVLPPIYSWTWRERLTVSAEGLFALPANVALEQLAMLRINPPTAALLLSEFITLHTGDWVVQNAANSGVGRSVIAIAKARGFKTINFVRRPELIEALKSAGGDIVLVDDEAGHAQVAALVGEGAVRLAIDGLSGAGAARLAQHLSRGAALVTFGLMSGEMTLPIGVLDLIFKKVSVHGFFQSQPEFTDLIAPALRESAALMASGALVLPVAATYPITAFKQAVAHAQRGGKVLLDLTAVS